jgi:hypothetical protein
VFSKQYISIAYLLLTMMMVGCAGTPAPVAELGPGKTVCDTYLVMSMCVQDVVGDGTVDMVYFTDTREIFMYQEGRDEAVADIMSLHRCAVPLNPGMQETTNQILGRENMTLSEEMSIARSLLSNYMQAKTEIDACNAQYNDGEQADLDAEDDFLVDDGEWEDG